MRNRSLYIVMALLLAFGLVGARLWYVERLETVVDSTADDPPETPKLPPAAEPAPIVNEKFEDELPRLVSQIGVALSKGDEEEIKSLRRKVKWTHPKELMQLFPDGIEAKFLEIAKKVPPRGEWPELTKAAYRIVAIAEVMDNQHPGLSDPSFNQPGDYKVWSRESLELWGAALLLAQMIEAENVERIASAAEKVNNCCVRCHSQFKGSDFANPEVNPGRRAAYIRALVKQPQVAVPFAPRLFLAARDKDLAVHNAAVSTLAALYGDPALRKLMGTTLIDALDDPSPIVQNAAAELLLRTYKDWKPTVPEFVEILKGKVPRRPPANASPESKGEPDSQFSRARLKQFQQLDQAGNDPEAIVKVLRNGLKDPDESVRTLAFELLTARAEFASAAIPDLCYCLEDADPIMRGRAALALTQLGKPAVLPLLAELKSTNRDARLSALTALGNIGAESAEATPMLLDVLKEKDPLVRLLAGLALKKIDPKAAETAGVK